MFCSQCGANNPDTAVVCAQCGRNLQAVTPASPLQPTPLQATGVVLPPGTMGKNRLPAAMFAACAAGVAMLRVFDPATCKIFPPCPVHYLTGWYCPGCGSLRAIHQLLHGDLRAAWALNPLTVILLPFLTYGLASFALLETRGRGLPQPLLRAVWIRALCGAIILFGIVRNLPLHPFKLLAPGAILGL